MTKGLLATARAKVFATSQDEALKMLHEFYSAYFGNDEYEIVEMEGEVAATAMGTPTSLWEVNAVARGTISSTDA